MDKILEFLARLFGFAKEVKEEKDRAESEQIHEDTQAANEEARARESARSSPPPLPLPGAGAGRPR